MSEEVWDGKWRWFEDKRSAERLNHLLRFAPGGRFGNVPDGEQAGPSKRKKKKSV